MRRIVAALLLACAVLAAGGAAAAAAPGGGAVRGVVVQRAGDAFVVAGHQGALVSVTGAGAPRIGTRVRVAGRRAAPGGAVRARSVREEGRAAQALVRAVVLARDPASRRYVVGEGAAAVVVRAPAHGALPTVGDGVRATVALGPGGALRQRTLAARGHRSRFELAGTLTAVDVTAGTLTLLLGAAQGADPFPALTVRALPGTEIGGCEPGDAVALAVRHDAGAGYAAVRDAGCELVADEPGAAEDGEEAGEDGVDVGNGIEDDGGASDREREPDDDPDGAPEDAWADAAP